MSWSTEPRTVKTAASGTAVTSRRKLLESLAWVGVAAALPQADLVGQFINKSTAKGGRIDVHHHFTPPALLTGPPARGRGGLGPWTPEQSLEQMDKFDIAVAILSMTQMGDILYDGTEKGAAAVRLGNDYGAKLMADHPKRFGLFTSVPLPDIDGVMKELEYGLDQLKSDGIGIYTNDNHNRWPGDPYYDPMWQELNRRKAIVFVHPHSPTCCSMIAKPAPQTVVEYGADTTRVIANLLFSGLAHKLPDITCVFAHGGGMMPYVIERFLNATTEEIVPGIITKGQGGKGVVGDNPRKDAMPNGVLYELRRMYYDTAQCSNPVAMGALRKVVPVSQIVFGTDFHWRTAEETGRGLITGKIFNDAELHAINRGNAERLLPRYRI